MNKHKHKLSQAPAPRFWVGLACGGALLLWFLIAFFLGMALGTTTYELAGFASDALINRILSILQSIAPYVIATVVTALCLLWVFRGLKVKKAAVGAVAIATLPFTMICVYAFLGGVTLGLYVSPLSDILTVVSFILSALFYIWLFRKAAQKLTDKGAILFAVSVPFVFIAFDLLWSLWVTTLI